MDYFGPRIASRTPFSNIETVVDFLALAVELFYPLCLNMYKHVFK